MFTKKHLIKFMFITYKSGGEVVAYSDKERNRLDLEEGEMQVEIDCEFTPLCCVEGSLKLKDGIFFNGDERLGKIVQA